MSRDEPGPRNEAEERSEAEAPDEFWRRRDFLARTAALAGVAGLASSCRRHAVSLAAKRQVRSRRFPSPRNMPIDTFVVLMMENRSFDHYFGWFPGADGTQRGLSYPDASGELAPTHHLPPDFQGCGFGDPDHSWDGGRLQYDGGRLDGFYERPGDGTTYALGYYLKQDLGFIPHAARSLHASTTATSARSWPRPTRTATTSLARRRAARSRTSCRRRRPASVGDDLRPGAARGLSAAYYVVRPPGAGAVRQSRDRLDPPDRAVLRRRRGRQAAADRLRRPALPRRRRRRRPRGDEHPHGDIRIGQAFMSDVAHAFIESPQYRRGALFINYDEWGGFFDHVCPRRVPDDRATPATSRRTSAITGFRIPGVGDLAVHPARRRQPHDGHPRVDPEADLLPLRARLPQHAPPLRLEHRPQPSTSSIPTARCPTCRGRRRRRR